MAVTGLAEKVNLSADQVIQILQQIRDANVPAWKRMRIIEGLITFRDVVQRRSSEDLVPLQTKMVDIIAIEQAKFAPR